MKIDWLRTSLIGGMLVVAFLLVIRWNEFQERQIAEQQVSEQTLPTSAVTATDVPSTDTQLARGPVSDIPQVPVVEEKANNPAPRTAPQSQLLHVKTDALEVLIDTHGGDIVKVALPQYYAAIDTPDEPFELLNRTKSHLYIAQSGLVGPDGTDSDSANRPTFTTEKTNYVIAENQDQVTVDLQLSQGSTHITKRFIFERGSNLIDIQYLVDNRSDSMWVGHIFGQIVRDDFVPTNSAGIGMQPYVGAAITTPEDNYQKIDFKDVRKDGPIKVIKQGGWVAMVQHYFISAWVPNQDATNQYLLRKSDNKDLYLLGYTGPRTEIAPHTSGVLETSFYAGPKDIKTLETISPYLDLTVDYGWLWWIAKPLFYTLDFIHKIVGNWGVSIILLTVLIKLIFFYPSAMSYRSMAKLRLVQPKMVELKERYGDDRQKMSAEMMKLYKKEKVNPLGGCLPVLLQMPVFLALYWVLMESVDLRHAPFFLWIQDLSVKDPYFILPLIMGATMFIQQKLHPPVADPMQAKVMQLMPIFFTFLFMVFPAGLVLYWVVNNTLSITQQYIINKQIEREGLAKS